VNDFSTHSLRLRLPTANFLVLKVPKLAGSRQQSIFTHDRFVAARLRLPRQPGKRL